MTSSGASMQVVPFPFAALPRFSAGDLALRRRVKEIYALLEEGKDAPADAASALSELVKQTVTVQVVRAEDMTLEEIVTSLPARFLLGVVRADPNRRRAFLVVEPALAHALVEAVLAGSLPRDADWQVASLRPITPLAEAVIEYAVVCFLERFSRRLGEKGFSLVFEDIVRDAKRLFGMYSHHDRFAVFSFRLELGDDEFHVKAALPVVMVETVGAEDRPDLFYRRRLESFGDFRLDFVLEAGHVELSPGELDSLREGDIVLLDECLATVGAGGVIEGRAILRPEGSDAGTDSVLLDIAPSADGLRGRVVSGV